MPQFLSFDQVNDGAVGGTDEYYFRVSSVDVGQCGDKICVENRPFAMVECVAGGGGDGLNKLAATVCNKNALVRCVVRANKRFSGLSAKV